MSELPLHRKLMIEAMEEIMDGKQASGLKKLKLAKKETEIFYKNKENE